MVGFFEKNSIHIILGDLDKCRCDYDKLRAYGLDINPYNFDIDEASKKIKKLFLKHHPDKGGDPEAFIELRKLEESVLEGYFSCLEKFRVGTQMDGCDPRIQKYSIGEDLITKCEDILDKKARIKHALEFIKKAEEEEELSENLMRAGDLGFEIFFRRKKSDAKDLRYPFSKYNLIKVYEPFPPWSDFRHAYYNYLLALGREHNTIPPYEYYFDTKNFYTKEGNFKGKNFDYYFKFVPKSVTSPSTPLPSKRPSPSPVPSNRPSPSPGTPLPSKRPSPLPGTPLPSNRPSPVPLKSPFPSPPWSSNRPSPLPNRPSRIKIYKSSRKTEGCPYIYTKGEKKGETCNIKPKGGVVYCARHKKYE